MKPIASQNSRMVLSMAYGIGTIPGKKYQQKLAEKTY
jgi:hypothetical protein